MIPTTLHNLQHRNVGSPHYAYRLSDDEPAASRSASRNTAGESTRHHVNELQLRWFLKLYPSLDSVIIRNATTLAFIRALAIWEAFPGSLHVNESIQCLSVDPGMKLVRTARVLHAPHDLFLKYIETR